ncbi:WhiB family transcriptional regulator [Cellulomonas sp. PhB143]|uniref:WhiB family transcriptional regulator n=1 Tax=Cellulomonas sp. PhB143 TaxID=2485186 RepID=UPI000F476666|nr:WhiB family transcriptional regulator [Cellulomonas sp. PhB143]ROS75361.1 transcription factor WhiB [Cellulomonas sp. PhB143]
MTDDELEHDHAALMRTLDRLEGGGARIPCRAAPVRSSVIWISEDPAEQAVAAARCQGCPALEECDRFGLAHTREGGVWGGRTVAERRAVARRLRRASAA